MTARSLRRAAERKAAKLARKQAKQVEAFPPTPAFAEEKSDSLRERKNHLYEKALQQIHPRQSAPKVARPSRRCTGPTTAEGKAISCLNRLKHGLTGTFRVLKSESQNLFDELRDALRHEHAPATATETLVVDRMAEHVWLSQRAQRFQDYALFEQNESSFALYLRYQTTNDRAFHKCLRELAMLRRECQQFESQYVLQPVPEFESQTDETRLLTVPVAANSSSYFESQNENLGRNSSVMPCENQLGVTIRAAPWFPLTNEPFEAADSGGL